MHVFKYTSRSLRDSIKVEFNNGKQLLTNRIKNGHAVIVMICNNHVNLIFFIHRTHIIVSWYQFVFTINKK